MGVDRQSARTEDEMVAVGDVAPDFEAADTSGQTVRLAAFRGTQNVVLVFNRGFR